MTKIAETIRTLAVATVLANGFTLASGVAVPGAAHASPASCVQQVMSGGINWGGGTTWQRPNAEALCRDVGDTGARLRCFTGAVAGGTSWRAAIQACQPIGKKVAATGNGVTGRNVGTVRFAGGAFEKRGSGWVETGASGQTRFRFEEQRRDDWSVYLYDASRNVSLQLDLHRDLVLYEGSALYPITGVSMAKAAPAPAPKVWTVEAGPIWNQGDAKGKCAAVAARNGAEWTGQWWTTVAGKMSVCQLKR